MTDAASRILAGSCLCGQVRYRVADEFRYAMNCHCSQCRRATGSAFKPFGGIERDKLSLAQGANNLIIHGAPDNHDARRKTCGSLLYVHVAFGTLTDAPAIRPAKHIFVGSKAPWFTITDDLPQHEAF